jgi:hypothetical protein
MALEACNALENYASYIRQVFFLERPTQPIMNGQNYAQAQPLPTPEPKPEPKPEQPPHRGLQLEGGAVNVKDIDTVFGEDEDM